jgi:putative spermidine/putrescine transport system permease protein
VSVGAIGRSEQRVAPSPGLAWTERLTLPLLLLPTALVIGLFLAALALVFVLSFQRQVVGGVSSSAFTLENYIHFLSDAYYLDVLLETFKLGLWVTTLAVIVGYPLAYFIARAPAGLRGPLRLVVLAPLLVSVVVRTYGWLILLAGNGPVNQALMALGVIQEPLRLLFNLSGVTIGLLHVFLPTMVLATVGVIEGVDRTTEEAAASLGSPPWRTFLEITLPLSLPGVVAGSMLVFSLTIAAYVTPALLGGPSLLILPTLIYQQVMVVLDWSFGAAMAAILLAASVLVLLVYQRVLALNRVWSGLS